MPDLFHKIFIKNEYLGVIIFLLFILFCFFFKAILGNLSLVPAETLYHIDNFYRNSNIQAEALPGNRLLFDLVFQMHPWQHFIREGLVRGFIPLWNPYSLTGLPFLANDQSSIFEISKLFSYLLHLPVKSWSLFSGIFQLFLAGFFTYLFSRNLKISKMGSVASGLIFMFSGPLIIWLGYPLVSVIIWLPFLLLGTDKIIRQPQKLWIGLFALAIGFQFFGGNPEISLFILCLTAFYALFRLSQLKPYREKYKVILSRAKFLAIATVLGFMIALVQLIPTIEFLEQSEALVVGRGGVAGANFFQIAGHEWNGWHNLRDIKHSLENFTILIYPDFFGNPVLKKYWGSLNYSESAFYVGIIPLIFASFALFGAFLKKINNRKEIYFWGATAIVCCGAFISLPIFRLVNYLPIFNVTAIGRLRFIFVFSLAILAGYGIDYFLKNKTYRQLKKKAIVFNIFYLGIVSSIFLAVLVWRKSASQFVTPEIWLTEKKLLLALFISLNIIFWLFLSSSLHPAKKRLAGKVFLILLIAGELCFYGYSYHPAIPYNFVYPKTPAIEFLQKNLGCYRVTSYKESLENFSSSLLPNGSVIWNIQDVRGYEIIKINRYETFERHFGGIDDRFIYKFFNQKIFNLLGIKYFAQGKDDLENEKLALEKNLSLVYTDQTINIYENKAVLPRAFTVFNIHSVDSHQQAVDVFLSEDFQPKKTATVEIDANLSTAFNNENNSNLSLQPASIVSYHPNKVELEIDLKQNGYLVLTDAYYPGWQAYLDNKEVKIYPTNIAFRGIFVPQGKHHIVFNYHPKSFFYSVYLSLIALMIVLFLIYFKKNNANKKIL
ncbi:MAG: YfhO family protein [Patescibacteria group bacterium]|nr:YfhO family protein [Patescibacteria group bacterium]